MSWTRRQLDGGVDLYHWPTDKFKTVAVRLYLHAPLSAETVTATALAAQLLGRACGPYTTTRSLTQRLEALYGADLATGVIKLGDVQSVYVAVEMVHDRYLPGGADVVEQTCDLLRLVLREPAGFTQANARQEQDNLARRIHGLVNDKVRYAVIRCVEEMFRGSPFALLALGRLEDLEGLDAAAARARYEAMTNQAAVTVFAVGGGPEVEAVLAERLAWPGRDVRPVSAGEPAPVEGMPGEPRVVVERQAVNQAKLALGYRTGIGLADDRYPALEFYNGILGGFPHSKLFRNVREKASLAYYANSRTEGLKGVLLVSSGVDPGRAREARRIIERQIEDLRQGRISDEEISFTRKGLVNRLRAALDSPGALIDAAVEELLGARLTPVEERLRQIEGVRRDDVVEVARSVRPDTVYFLTAPEAPDDLRI